jgi:diguanylate cyclase (GGDEF)-like protein
MAAVVVGVLVAASAVVGFGWGGPEVEVAVADLSSLAAAVLATVAIWRARRRGDRVSAWTALLITFVLWTIGELLWTTWEVVLDREVPYPSIADVAYLGAVPFGVLALVRFGAGSGARNDARGVLDGCIVATSTLFVGWAVALGPAFRGDGESFLSHLVTVSYPLTDVVLVVLAVVVLQRVGSDVRTPLLWVAAGFVAMSVADSAYTWLVANDTYAGDGLVTMLWPAGYLLVAAGARSESHGRRGSEAPAAATRVSLLLPYVPLAAATVVAAVRLAAGEPLGPFLGTVGVVLVGLVLGRQAITAWELRETVAALHEREQELARLAMTDALTGLPNRARFGQAMEEVVAAPIRPAVLYIDLDGFKAVNDLYGHDMGDRLLVDAADRLQRAAGISNLVARLGGDEFVVLVPGGHAPAVVLAQRVLDAFSEPFAVDGDVIRFQASVGVAAAPPGASPDEAVRRADAAMYVAKATGKGRAVDYPDETIVTA